MPVPRGKPTSARYAWCTSPESATIEAGGVPFSPVPTSRTSATMRSSETPNAAQCSRSTAWRIRSPSRAAGPPQAPLQTASFQDSR